MTPGAWVIPILIPWAPRVWVPTFLSHGPRFDCSGSQKGFFLCTGDSFLSKNYFYFILCNKKMFFFIMLLLLSTLNELQLLHLSQSLKWKKKLSFFFTFSAHLFFVVSIVWKKNFIVKLSPLCCLIKKVNNRLVWKTHTDKKLALKNIWKDVINNFFLQPTDQVAGGPGQSQG